MIYLNEDDLIGQGSERKYYLHPEDKNKGIKVSFERKIGRSKQSDIEIKYYKELQKNKKMSYKHLPKFYEEVQTDQGLGFVVEVVRDYTGEISKSFKYYIDTYGVEKYENELEEYKQYLLDYLVIFNYGMMPKNILLRYTSESEAELVLIDGVGDITYFTFPNKIPLLARRKIQRRWIKFVNKYLKKDK